MRKTTLKTHSAGWTESAATKTCLQHSGCDLPDLYSRLGIAAMATVGEPECVLTVTRVWRAVQRKNLWKPDLSF